MCADVLRWCTTLNVGQAVSGSKADQEVWKSLYNVLFDEESGTLKCYSKPGKLSLFRNKIVSMWKVLHDETIEKNQKQQPLLSNKTNGFNLYQEYASKKRDRESSRELEKKRKAEMSAAMEMQNKRMNLASSEAPCRVSNGGNIIETIEEKAMIMNLSSSKTNSTNTTLLSTSTATTSTAMTSTATASTKTTSAATDIPNSHGKLLQLLFIYFILMLIFLFDYC